MSMLDNLYSGKVGKLILGIVDDQSRCFFCRLKLQPFSMIIVLDQTFSANTYEQL